MKNLKLIMLTLIMGMMWVNNSLTQEKDNSNLLYITYINHYSLKSSYLYEIIQNGDTTFTLQTSSCESNYNVKNGKITYDTSSAKLISQKQFKNILDLYYYLESNSESNVVYQKLINKLNKINLQDTQGYEPSNQHIDLRLRKSSEYLIKSQDQALTALAFAVAGGLISPLLHNSGQYELGNVVMVGAVIISLSLTIESIYNKRLGYKKLRL